MEGEADTMKGDSVSFGKIWPGSYYDLPSQIKSEDIILDVGGGLRPLSRADYVLDFLGWDERTVNGAYFLDVWPRPFFTKERWIQWDLCAKEPWPFQDKQFDFVVCRHTLEDVRDPVWVCSEMMRVGKAGYIETPSRILESTPGVERTRYCGYSHHHWLCEMTSEGIVFLFKHAQLHGYSRFHLGLGPDWHKMRRNHHWSEAFDWVQRLLVVANRWLRAINPKYHYLGMYWTGSFKAEEKILIDKGEVERDLMQFRERVWRLPDLWVWKRTWYGKRIHRNGLQ